LRHELQYALWLSRQAGGVLLLPVISLVSLILAAIMHRALRRFWKPYYWFVLTHLSFFAAAMVVGTCGVADGPAALQPVQPNRAASPCVGILFWTSSASFAFWIGG